MRFLRSLLALAALGVLGACTAADAAPEPRIGVDAVSGDPALMIELRPGLSVLVNGTQYDRFGAITEYGATVVSGTDTVHATLADVGGDRDSGIRMLIGEDTLTRSAPDTVGFRLALVPKNPGGL